MNELRTHRCPQGSRSVASSLWIPLFALGMLSVGCSGSGGGNAQTSTGGSAKTGGVHGTGGVVTGGTTAGTGGVATGGVTVGTGGVTTGGVSVRTGGVATGGVSVRTGGLVGAGGSATGGIVETGGTLGTGGVRTGGVAGTGGMAGTGGAVDAGSADAALDGSGGRDAGRGGNPLTGGTVSTGGTAGTGGSPGTGGVAAFAPCPATGQCKIMPLGDSITDGTGFSGGYRVELFTRAVTDKKNITFVGSLSNGPTTVAGVTFPKSHEGHFAWTIQQIDDIVPTPTLNVSPHIVLLHIGTNDINQNLSGAPDRLKSLINQIVTALPNALVAVAKIIPEPSKASGINTYNAAVPGIVDGFIQSGKHLILVDQNTGFPSSELGDGVHPNQAGYKRMGDTWYEAIKSYLP